MSTATTNPVAIQRRTGWDIALGIVLLLAGFVVLGDVGVATAVSVYFIGWMALFGGAVAFVASFFRIGKGGFWPMLLGGGAIAVLGLMVLRNPLIGAAALTLVAGSLFFAAGLTRIVAAFQEPEHRWLLLIGGAIGVILGLWVLLHLTAASFALLGVLLGVQMLVEGITIITVGRWHHA